MKKFMKIGALSLALIASLFFLSNATHAASGDLKLKIEGASGSCDYGTHLDLGTTGFSYDARTMSGNFKTDTGALTPWTCRDSAGVASWNLTITSSDVANVTTNNVAHTIPATSVKIENPTATVISGLCTKVGGDSSGSYIAINSPVVILGKSAALGEACIVQTAHLDLSVDLAASQAIGQYSGTLTVAVPSL